MFADGIKQAREQEFTGWMGTGEEAGDQIASAAAFPFLAGKQGRIDKRAIGFVAAQKTFFKKAIEGGHYGGVGERAAQLRGHVADAAFGVGPEDFHQFEFQGAKRRTPRFAATADAIF